MTDAASDAPPSAAPPAGDARWARRLAWLAALGSVGFTAWESSARRVLTDAHLPWWPGWVLAAALLGVALAALARRRAPAAWAPLPGRALDLVALVTLLMLGSVARVSHDTTVSVLREGVPAWIAWLPLLVAGAAPLWLARSGVHHARGTQLLALCVALTTADGVLAALDGGGALLLAGLALLEELPRRERGAGPRALSLCAVATVTLLLLAAVFAPDRLDAVPAARWIAALSLLAVAVALRARDAAAWRLLLAAPTATALLVAAAGFSVHVGLGLRVGWAASWGTRTAVLGQHANFLALLFAVHALLAAGLARASFGVARRAWTLGAAALVVATWLTGSRAGQGALLVGALLLLASPWVLRGRATSRGATGRLAAAAALLLLGAAAWASWDLAQPGSRLEASFAYRVEAWLNSAALVARDPWLGIGPGSFESLRRFAPGSRFFMEPLSPHPHSVPLYVAQAGGVLALLAFLGWVAALLRALARRAARELGASRALTRAAFAAVCALLLADLVDVGLALHTVVPAPLFLLTGLCAGRRRAGGALAKASTARDPTVAASERGATRTAATPGARVVASRRARVATWGLALLVVPAGASAVLAEGRAQQTYRLQIAAEAARADGTAAGAASAAELNARAGAALRRALTLDPFRRASYAHLVQRARLDDPARVERGLAGLARHAPHEGRSLALRGHFARQRGRPEEALELLRASLAAGHGGRHQNRDRAAVVELLAELGRRAECLAALAQAIQHDVDVLHGVRWTGRGTAHSLRLGPAPDAAAPTVATDAADDGARLATTPPPTDELHLADALHALVLRQRARRAAGEVVGRDFWMASFHALRLSGDVDRAVLLLDDLEAHASVDAETLARERARLAEQRGDLADAQRWFERGHALSGRAWFAGQAERVAARREGRAPRASDALPTLHEILDQPSAFREAYESRAAASTEPAARAAALARTPLFVDDWLERAERLLEIAEAWLAADEPARALRWGERCHALLASPPAPTPSPYAWDHLEPERDARLARLLADCWRALDGVDPAAARAALWRADALETLRPQLLLALHHELGEADALLAADAALAHRALGLRWWRLDALEALGRGEELPATAAALLSEAPTAAVDAAAPPGPGASAEVHAHFGVARLLAGALDEADAAFARAAELTRDAHLAAHRLGWRARVASLHADDARRAEVRALLDAALARFPDCGALRARRRGVARTSGELAEGR